VTHVCPWWLAYSFDNRLRRLFHKPERILAGLLKEGDTALDVGCGMGFFSIAMAALVGSRGRVVAVDLQSRMLEALRARAARAGVLDRITTQLAAETDLGVRDPVDFALASWMLHEVPDPERLLRQVHDALKPGAAFLVTEPRLHVSGRAFEASLALATKTGFRIHPAPEVAFSRAAVLRRAQV
jgi:ubiquinone/menaquinone biosynthesis C-methylase UbiE